MSKLPKLGQMLKKGDAKHRVFIILIAVVLVLFAVYLIGKFFTMQNNSVGSSKVSSLPNVESVQGRETSPAYRSALEQRNAQRASHANTTGTSSIATIINSGEAAAPISASTCSNCCSACDGEALQQAINKLLGSNKISPDVASALDTLTKANLSPEDYAAELDRLVREGKLTPEQARKLLAAYKKDHASKIAQAGAADLDPMIKNGELSVGAANHLLDLQKKDLTPDEYAAELQRMVDAGEITPEQAAALLAKYKAQRSKRLAAETQGQLKGMVDTGAIPSDVAGTLAALQGNNVPVEDYATTLGRLVKEGKLTPEQAQRLLDQYKKQHGLSTGKGELDKYANTAELSAQDGAALQALQSQNVSVAEFAAKLQKLVQSGSISTETARRLITQYQAESSAKQKVADLLKQENGAGKVTSTALTKLQQEARANVSIQSFSADVQALVSQSQVASSSAENIVNAYNAARDAATKKDQLIDYFKNRKKLSAEAAAALEKLQNQGSSVGSYADQLQRLVDAGLISPETANALLTAYNAKMASQASAGSASRQPPDFTTAAIDSNFVASGNAELDRVARAGAQQQAAVKRSSYTGAAALQSQQQQAQAQQQTDALVQAKLALMLQQANKLIAPNIAAIPQTYVAGAAAAADAVGGPGGAVSAAATAAGLSESSEPPVIKAGTILYAVLDTAVNSDYAESPIMATIVAGKFKGAKLLGSISTVKNGQRVMLQFDTLTEDSWPTGKKVTAYAIDPDTARTAVATDVNNHYLLRYGSLFASSFLQGLGQAVSESGTSVSSDDGVVTSSTDDLDTDETILVALGTVGANAASEVNKLVSTPPTVKVASGVGIGILFMADVAASDDSAVQAVAAQKATQGGAK